MNEYIEREAALNICQKKYEDHLRMFDYCGDTVAWNIGEAIKGILAADVVPVVRCKDCKYYKMVYALDREDGMRCIRERYTRDVTDNDFCSYGERRTDND